MKKFNRRLFLKYSMGTLASVSFLPHAFGDVVPPPLSETDPLAQSFKYHADASKAPEHKGAATKQKCSNCGLFGELKGSKSSGTCQLFAGKSVSAKGWCQSWVEKPKK